jgi:hypothetical protein
MEPSIRPEELKKIKDIQACYVEGGLKAWKESS